MLQRHSISALCPRRCQKIFVIVRAFFCVPVCIKDVQTGVLSGAEPHGHIASSTAVSLSRCISDAARAASASPRIVPCWFTYARLADTHGCVCAQTAAHTGQNGATQTVGVSVGQLSQFPPWWAPLEGQPGCPAGSLTQLCRDRTAGWPLQPAPWSEPAANCNGVGGA